MTSMAGGRDSMKSSQYSFYDKGTTIEPKFESMLDSSSMKSLQKLKVQGISQFNREVEQTQNLDKSRQVCLVKKLQQTRHTTHNSITHGGEMVLAEHCSPRLLF